MSKYDDKCEISNIVSTILISDSDKTTYIRPQIQNDYTFSEISTIKIRKIEVSVKQSICLQFYGGGKE